MPPDLIPIRRLFGEGINADLRMRYFRIADRYLRTQVEVVFRHSVVHI